MSSVRNNLAANVIGHAYSAFLLIVFTPIYLRVLGVEAYALIGFFVTLQVLFSVLDLGFTATLSRELARLSSDQKKNAQEMQDLVRTLELLYWCIGLAIFCVVAISAHWIATQWLNTSKLQPSLVSLAVSQMGMICAFRMLYGFYGGGVLGLQKQILLNSVKILVETVRTGGAVLVILMVAPSIEAFFYWHVFTSIFAVWIMRALLLKNLPPAGAKPQANPRLLANLWKYGTSISAIAILSVVVVELDKLILSKMLPLKEFGYYVLASTVAMGLNLLTVPVVMAVQPRLTQLAASNDLKQLRRLYHDACQLVALLIMPIALCMSFFSYDILLLWTGKLEVASTSAPVLSILAVGTALNAVLNIPYALQLAYGWTRLALILILFAALFLVPYLIIMIANYGMTGAASMWVVVNSVNILISLPIVTAKFIPGELGRWLVLDFAAPGLAALVTVGVGWYFMPQQSSVIIQGIWIVMTGVAAYIITAFVTPLSRRFALDRAAG